MIKTWRVTLAAAALLLMGCHHAPQPDTRTDGKAGTEANNEADPRTHLSEEPAAAQGVSLEPEEVTALGIATTAAESIQSSPEAQGFGVVLPHEAIAVAVAEVRTAIAAEQQSQAALARSKRLTGTPGAMPAEMQETAQRQSIADRAALELANQKLSSSLGLDLPKQAELLALAGGQSKLVHVTFPLGVLGETDPNSIRLGRIDASQGGRTWQSNNVWHAPADAALPGRSYFAILKNTDAAEGDHLLAWTAIGATEPGVLVPAAAAVISGGQFFCYIEEKPGTYVRTAFDPGRPTALGYFVKEGIAAGDKIVTHAAGQLLARETNPSKEADQP